MEEDIFSIAKSRNINKMVEIFDRDDFDIYQCDEHGNALTHICCRLGLIDIVKLLIEKGVNFNSCTNSEDTALHCAVQSNNEEIVDLLIPLPILLDEQNCLGNSPLHYACFLSNKNIALKLLKSGCNISTRNKFNQTPLDLSPLDMAEELAKEFNLGNYSSTRSHLQILQKRCPRAVNLSTFRLEPYIKMEDISLVDISYKNFLEEIWNARLNALDRKVIVRKIFPERNKKLITSIFIQEYHSLDISNVKSILPPAGFLYSTLQLWVIQPYSELAGTLYSFLRNKSINIPEEISLNLAINVCQGVQYIHKNPNLLNRYIPTTHNILVNDNLEAKLNLGQCPFSFQSKDKIINPQYFSPEALTFRMGGYDKFSSDMWSFGIVLYELFARSLPYDDKNSMHTGYNIAIARLYPQLKLSNAQIDKIMNLCLNPVPSKRPQLHQITPILIKMKELLNEK